MCFENETIEVPQADVKTMIDAGAICGGCDERCCPDTPRTEGKLDMCLQEHTVNVSENACKGLLNAGATCGPCIEENIEETTEEIIVEKETITKPV